MAMAGERVPAGTGETSVATQKNNTTPLFEKSAIGLRNLICLTMTTRPARHCAAAGIAAVTAAPLPQSNER
jgi:hypothetical protein